MNHDTEKIKDEYHTRLVREGYSVLPRLPFDGVAGKFALYAIHNKSGREKLIQIKDFSDAEAAEPLLESLEALSNAKTRIELATFERRSSKPSELELELIAANVTRSINNDFCANIAGKKSNYVHTEYRDGLLHARFSTGVYQPIPTRRFVLI